MAKRRRKRSVLGEVTKRDFVAIAKVLCEHGAPPGLVRDLSSYFSSQNPRFAAERFEAAARTCRGR